MIGKLGRLVGHRRALRPPGERAVSRASRSAFNRALLSASALRTSERCASPNVGICRPSFRAGEHDRFVELLRPDVLCHSILIPQRLYAFRCWRCRRDSVFAREPGSSSIGD
jgi:hypothetical protein